MDQPDDGNFTPLHHAAPKKKHNKVVNFFLINAVSLFAGISVVVFVYITQQAIIPKTYTSKASEDIDINSCFKSNIPNPATVQAWTTIQKKSAYVNDGEEIKTNSITFKWDPIPDVNFYHIALSNIDPDTKKGRIDPVEVGTKSTQLWYTFKDLKPNKDYYLFIRSQSSSGKIGIIYPTPGDCKTALPALPIFHFKTADET